jgi:hypothetical protein
VFDKGSYFTVITYTWSTGYKYGPLALLKASGFISSFLTKNDMGICARHIMQEQWEHYWPVRTDFNKRSNLSFNWNVYSIQLWGTATNSNINILERFQSKVLRIITDAPGYVPNAVIKHDLQVPSVRQEVWTYSVTYHARFEGHPNDLAISLLQQPPYDCRLKQYYPSDLVTRF